MLIRTLFVAALAADGAAAQAPVVLRERTAGMPYAVAVRVDLSGTLAVPADPGQAAPPPVKVTGTSVVEYEERLLAPLADGTARAARLYRNVDFRRTVGNRPQDTSLRPAARRMIVLRMGSRELPFSPDGPLTYGEIDVVRTDVFTPALAGLLPGQPVQVGDRWPAVLAAVEELTDMDRIDQGGVECQLAAVDAGRRVATVRFAGTVRGLNEDGPNQQTLDGSYTVDLNDELISGLTVNGTSVLLDPAGKATGRVEGRFTLTRRRTAGPPELSDAALRGLTLEPTPANSLLVYEGNVAGLRFLYPRRWRVKEENDRQVTLDDGRGSGVRITAEPRDKIPTAAQVLREAERAAADAKSRVVRAEPARRLPGPPLDIETFGVEFELDGQRSRADYYIARTPAGGATVIGRLRPGAGDLRPELEAIVKSLAAGAPAPAGVVPLPGK
jgi:hypothetical protein